MNIKNANIFSYADDTAIVFSGPSWQSTKADAENGMIHVSKWLQNNLLTLNTSKTNYICFSIFNNFQPNNDFKLQIHECNTTKDNDCNCPIINKVTHTKYLGVLLDQRLSWSQQIELLNERIRKFIWMFKSLRYVVPKHRKNNTKSPKSLLNEIYIALVQSIISYCITVWGGACKSNFLEVERGQRALLKVMYFKKRRFPTDSLYTLCDLMSIRKLYILNIILKTHKKLTYDPITQQKRKTHNVISTQRTRTTFARNQYKCRSSYIYNKVNQQLQIYTKNYYECKSTLTTWLKKLNYEECEKLLEILE